ncbi:MAG: PQQ-binding-like beta-propeller repeat protein [Rhodobacteraceae bacterium]|nr:PQQ-binding-like beta-propeller repeat protein [Paracoccaceae bacterium]
MFNKKVVIGIVSLSVLVGCSQKDEILAGYRIDIERPLTESAEIVSEIDGTTTGSLIVNNPIPGSKPFDAPPSVNLTEWTHVNANPRHNPGNLRIDGRLTVAWQRNFGVGSTLRNRLASSPVIAQNIVFTMDAVSNVRAYDTNGNLIWGTPLGSDLEEAEASSGGLAYGEGLLFATTGFGELHVLDPDTGGIYWTQGFDAPAVSSPTVHNGFVYLITLDSKAWSLDIRNGRLNWSLESTGGIAMVAGDTSPAISGNDIILPFPSAEVVSANAQNGSINWREYISGSRRTNPSSTLIGISSSPVIANNQIYLANQSGSTVALNPSSGTTTWLAPDGSYNPPLPAGDSVFLVTDDFELVRLDATTGLRIWSTDLPSFKADNPRRRKEVFAHFGPLLVGGELVVASSDGLIRFFTPETGEVTRTIAITGGATSAPIVVNRTMYLKSSNGTLYALN